MEKSIWQEIEKLYQEFQKLGIGQLVDYEKYYLYSLITHSTPFKKNYHFDLTGAFSNIIEESEAIEYDDDDDEDEFDDDDDD